MEVFFNDNNPIPTLIDLFLIIGYDTDEDSLNCYNDKIEVELNNPHPTILGTVQSIMFKDNALTENDYIRLLFPNPPNVYSSSMKNVEKYIQSYERFFTFQEPKADEEGKKSIYGYSYIFYEQLDTCYVPKAFFILSKYPLYAFYRKLSQYILSQYKEENLKVPIEILLFNIINFIPATFNNSIILLLPQREIITPENKRDSIVDQTNLRTSFVSVPEERPSLTPGMNKAILKSLQRKQILQRFDNPSIKIHEVNHFPYIDLNLSQLLNYIQPEMLGMIMIFTFFHYRMFLVSEDEKVLDCILQMIAHLNYPFNDINLFNNVVILDESVFYPNDNDSEDENEDTCNPANVIINNPFSNLIGIKGKIDLGSFRSMVIKDGLFFDLNTNTYDFWEIKVNSEKNKTEKDLFYYLKKGMKLNDDKKYVPIMNGPIIDALCDLTNKLKDIQNKDKRQLYVEDDYDHQLNYQIQNIFYEFNLDMVGIFYNLYRIENNYQDLLSKYEHVFINRNNYVIRNLESMKKNSKEEGDKRYFSECVDWESPYRISDRFEAFFNKFIDNDKCDEAKRRDYSLFLSFLQYKKYLKDINCSHNIDYMDIIYRYYQSDIEQHSSISFDYFDENYAELIQPALEKEIAGANHIVCSLSNNEDEIEKNIKYKYIQLNQSIINKYYFYLHSLPKEKIIKLFPFIKQRVKPKEIKVEYELIERFVYSQIEEMSVDKTKKYMLFKIILNITYLTISAHLSKSPFFYILYNSTNENDYPIKNLRKYIQGMIYLLYNNIKEKQKNNKIFAADIKTINSLIFYLMKNKFIPNYQLYTIIKQISAIEQKYSQHMFLDCYNEKVDTSFTMSTLYQVSYTSVDKKKSQVKCAEMYRQIILEQKPNNKEISVVLNHNVKGRSYTAQLMMIDQMYTASEVIMNSFNKEKKLSDYDKATLKDIIINVIACNSIDNVKLKIDEKGFVETLSLL